ncbi:MAG: hypothetical protein OEW68_16615 [Gammaproteobacteria bacterium]|nr:hypothetical protein [Gammaproteobacteria bacterium]
MKKHEAIILIGHLFKAQTALAEAAEELSTLEDKDEALSLKKTVAEAVGTIAADAIAPILQLFPDLDPYDS